MRETLTKFLPVLFLILLLPSCIDDSAWYDLNDIDVQSDTLLREYIGKQTGLFVINEGNFTYDNASLSYYFIDSMKVLNEVFFRSNALPLGDIALSMVIRDSLGFIVVNNSNKIMVINTSTFELEGMITGLTSPRYIHFVSDTRAYVTDLYARAITIVDPSTFEITGYIDVNNGHHLFYQHSTEQMVRYDRYVFTNCWSYDNQVLVIDTEIDEVIDSITVPAQPNSLVMDRFNRLWVLCDGGYPGTPFEQQPPALVRIYAPTLEIEKTYTFEMNESPSELAINGTRDTLYFLDRHVYRHPVSSASAPDVLIESTSEGDYAGGYYGLGVDPHTGEIYVGDAIDHIRQGKVYRYTAGGLPVDTFLAGIIPGSFCFKK